MFGEQLLFAPRHRNLRLAVFFFIIPFLYSRIFKGFHKNVQSVELSMDEAWQNEIVKPGSAFKRVVIGFSVNVDLVAPGVNVIESLNTTITNGENHELITSLQEFHETFSYFFQRGAAAERKSHRQLGGNAALLADRIASSFPATEVYLVGPIGPRSQALLHPGVKKVNSTRIIKDELHVILEYKKGEILGDWVSPSSSRFITSHDIFSSSALVMEMLFNTVQQFKPDLILVSGVHLLEFQEKESRLDKLQKLRWNILQVSPKVPIHFHLGSLGDGEFLSLVLNKIIPHVDSIGINEQELSFLSHVAGGPYMEEYPIQSGTTHPHKVVEMLYWLMKTYGRDIKDQNSKNAKYRLQRIHFQCMTYHIMVSTGSDWSNLGSALSAGARLAGKISCNIPDSHDSDMLEIRMAHNFPLDKHIGKTYSFDPHNPLSSWIRDNAVFVFTPVLVCKYPQKTVGVEDAIASTALMYSQFYRFQHWQ